MPPPFARPAVTLAVAVAALAGCAANYDFNTVEIARTALVGLREQDVRMCAGFPDRTSSEDGVTVWSYEQQTKGNGLTVSTPVLFGAANTALNMSSAGSCRVQFRFQNGRVDRIAYAGDNDGPRGRDTLCTPIVDDCLAYARRFKDKDLDRDLKAIADARAGADVELVTGSLPAAEPAKAAEPPPLAAAPTRAPQAGPSRKGADPANAPVASERQTTAPSTQPSVQPNANSGPDSATRSETGAGERAEPPRSPATAARPPEPPPALRPTKTF
ncbi:hypothetical protein [Chthonobacter rhizosphaerae]|uniref:hypothetical protein n=1 Tax=Chthonobacter rhizosphaerae TaxID=2735553 RepID=UPI0015EFB72C|nr:hypothetical protein [Chthonobacter rhizosphaerae]